MVTSAIAGATMVLVLAGCGQASITSGAPYSSGTPDVVDVAVDFFQDHDRVGKLYIRTREAHGNLVRFLIEVPIVADSDYRLDTVDFEFMSDVIQPLIMLEPSGGTLTQDISFTRVGSMVRLSVPDTGQHGDGTVLFNFLAEKEVFAGHGLQLHAELGFGAGDAQNRVSRDRSGHLDVVKCDLAKINKNRHLKSPSTKGPKAVLT